jgi:hypothetical protein
MSTDLPLRVDLAFPPVDFMPLRGHIRDREDSYMQSAKCML